MKNKYPFPLVLLVGAKGTAKGIPKDFILQMIEI